MSKLNVVFCDGDGHPLPDVDPVPSPSLLSDARLDDVSAEDRRRIELRIRRDVIATWEREYVLRRRAIDDQILTATNGPDRAMLNAWKEELDREREGARNFIDAIHPSTTP